MGKLSNKKQPSATPNWVNNTGQQFYKANADRALDKIKNSRSGKKFKLIPNPSGKGMIEIEDNG